MVIRAEERKETVGVLRLIGISRKTILTEVVVEGLLVAIAGAAVRRAHRGRGAARVNRFFQARYNTALVFMRVSPRIACGRLPWRFPSAWSRGRWRHGLCFAATRLRWCVDDALGLAWRTARAVPAGAVLAIVGVAVIGALNFDMLMLSQGWCCRSPISSTAPTTTSASQETPACRCRGSRSTPVR